MIKNTIIVKILDIRYLHQYHFHSSLAKQFTSLTTGKTDFTLLNITKTKSSLINEIHTVNIYTIINIEIIITHSTQLCTAQETLFFLKTQHFVLLFNLHKCL